MHDSDASSSELLDTMVADKINDYLDQPAAPAQVGDNQALYNQLGLSAKFKKPPAKPLTLCAQLKTVLGAVLGESRRR